MEYIGEVAIGVTLIGVWWAITVVVGAARRLNKERVKMEEKMHAMEHVLKSAYNLTYEWRHSDHTPQELIDNHLGQLDMDVSSYYHKAASKQ